MQKKLDSHIFTGLKVDYDVTKSKPEFLVDARNIRFTTRGDNTLLALTNEQGTINVEDYSTSNSVIYRGKYLGHSIIGKYLIVFTKEENDYIYRSYYKDNKLVTEILYKGNLNFNINNPLQTFSLYETNLIQKVYWVDGINQARVINVVKDLLDETNVSTVRKSYKDDSFDFIQNLKLEEEVNVYSLTEGTGMFPAGCIQYAFSYFNKYGTETNLAWISPLYYTTFIERGGSPEETISTAFKISINNIDKNFDYIRLYSIIRTSEQAVPQCKIVEDINIKSLKSIEFTDYNTLGTNIDPTALLYIGGEEIIPSTLASKDNTLFLANYSIKRPSLKNININHIPIKESVKNVELKDSYREYKVYKDTSTATDIFTAQFPLENTLIPPKGVKLESPKTFKSKETYRFGLQFQYKNGKWSEPLLINDYVIDNHVNYKTDSYLLPSIKADINLSELLKYGYKKVRPVIVEPKLENRTILAQGMICPTVYNVENHSKGTPHYQASWFARVIPSINHPNSDAYPEYRNETLLPTNDKNNCEISINASDSLLAYIKENNQDDNTYLPRFDTFKVSYKCFTLNSPDIEFNEDLWLLDYNNIKCRTVGKILFNSSYGDISLQVSSPSINKSSSGFIHKVLNNNYGASTLLTGKFYNGGFVGTKDDSNKIVNYNPLKSSSVFFSIYPWHKTGSITNDSARSDGTTTSSVLKKKVISNIRFSNKTDIGVSKEIKSITKIFTSDQVSAVKLNDNVYYGNIDTLINSNSLLGIPFYVNSNSYDIPSSYSSIYSNKIIHLVSNEDGEPKLIYSINGSTTIKEIDINNLSDGRVTAVSNQSVRMKYKSTPHAVIYNLEDSGTLDITNIAYDHMILGELYRDIEYPYGNPNDEEILKSQLWIPAGDSYIINPEINTEITWKYGDTFYQRYDCLKTYPFTQEDENGVVDINSFMCETRINLGGRYDKNKNQLSNLYMTPQNFNLLNPVYSQKDNYFGYRLLDEDFYKINNYSNDITWSLQKTNGEDIDEFTNINLTSTLSIDGDKGKITTLEVNNNNIYIFQEKGISQLLFNSRVQIPVTEGQPIEISNNYKVDGNTYISDILGCNNKWSISNTPSGLYFIESNTNELYHIGSDGLKNVSSTNSMSTWFKNNSINRLWYDNLYNDLYINTDRETLVFSELLGLFTSFMDYQEASAMFNFNHKFLALSESENREYLWSLWENSKHNYIFNKYRDYGISFISNLDAVLSKVFTNIDLRADWFKYDVNTIEHKFLTKDFFDSIRVTDTYQDTSKIKLWQDVKPLPNLKKKFRVWNIQIPRDIINIKEGSKLKDRINDTWCKIDLFKNKETKSSSRMELHDLSVSYYI